MILCGKTFLNWILKHNASADSGNFKSTVCTFKKMTNFDNKCTFCDIIKRNDQSKIIFEDELVVVFPDIRPASTTHLLIVPKNHILDVKRLNASHLDLIHHMISIGKNVLDEKQYDSLDTRFGFHWPPFRTISHLHLHAIAPISEMTLLSRLIFKENSWWFVCPEYIVSRLESMKSIAE